MLNNIQSPVINNFFNLLLLSFIDKIRNSTEYENWRKAVYKRDNYMCKFCKKQQRNHEDLNTYHIKPWSEYPESIFDVNNGVTLCGDCYKQTFGKGELYEKFLYDTANKSKMFSESYFIGGKKSNYIDYRKRKYVNLANDLTEHFKKTDKIVDFGAGTGELIYQLVTKGFNIVGTDVSEYAINYGKKTYGLDNIQYYNLNLLAEDKDWVLLLDVCEHMTDWDLEQTLNLLSKYPAKKGIILRVPVCDQPKGKYVLDVSENDKTHIQRKTKKEWIEIFKTFGHEVEEYLHQKTIHDNEGVLAIRLKTMGVK